MKEGTLDISVYSKAVTRLGEIIARYQLDINDDGIRDAVIQRFEFTYSVTLKTLSKYLSEHSFENVKQMSFNDIIRSANQLDLLKSNLEKWTEFRCMRNLTSHTYDEEIAMKVVSVIPDFYEETSFLLEQLRINLND